MDLCVYVTSSTRGLSPFLSLLHAHAHIHPFFQPKNTRKQLPGDTLDRVWTTLKHSLRTHGLALLRNRHLDHPVLCAFYAMCKVHMRVVCVCPRGWMLRPATLTAQPSLPFLRQRPKTHPPTGPYQPITHQPPKNIHTHNQNLSHSRQ